MKSVNTITVPMPDRALNAHPTHGGKWVKTSATKRARNSSAILWAASGRPEKPYEQATVHYSFFLPDKRRRDEQNLKQMLKPTIDGAVDAGIIVDDSIWNLRDALPSDVQVDKQNPRVVITIRQSLLPPDGGQQV